MKRIKPDLLNPDVTNKTGFVNRVKPDIINPDETEATESF
jgi:hypothetical protein